MVLQRGLLSRSFNALFTVALVTCSITSSPSVAPSLDELELDRRRVFFGGFLQLIRLNFLKNKYIFNLHVFWNQRDGIVDEIVGRDDVDANVECVLFLGLG